MNFQGDKTHCYFTILKHRKKGPFWFFLGPNDFIWSALKVWFSDFIQNLSQAPSKCLSKHKSEDKLDYLKNPSRDFKNYFCSRVPWIPSNAEWQNWTGPFFLWFNIVKYQCDRFVNNFVNRFTVFPLSERNRFDKRVVNRFVRGFIIPAKSLFFGAFKSTVFNLQFSQNNK